MIRHFRNGDAKKILEMHKQYSPDQELDFERILYHGISENENGIVVYGAVKEFNEIVISVNKDAPLRDRVSGIEELLKICIHLANVKGNNKLFALADKDFSEILQKHYGFTELSERVLALRINDGPQES